MALIDPSVNDFFTCLRSFKKRDMAFSLLSIFASIHQPGLSLNVRQCPPSTKGQEQKRFVNPSFLQLNAWARRSARLMFGEAYKSIDVQMSLGLALKGKSSVFDQRRRDRGDENAIVGAVASAQEVAAFQMRAPSATYD